MKYIKRIAIHDAEQDHMPSKTFPNFTLMKISAWHKKQGDSVEWFCAINKKNYDLVYSSKVFDFTPENEYLSEGTIKGGTGYGIYNKLPLEVDGMFPDYSIYPACDFAIGFLTRGCIRACDWCVVPKKEGNIKPYKSIREVVRHDTNKIVFMDNNVLACQHGIEQLKELAKTDYSVDFNQGLDIRLLTPEIAENLSQINWTRFIRFSCDSISQIEYFERVMPLFKKYKWLSKISIYLLVRRDTHDAEFRLRTLYNLNKNFHFYPQSERNNGVEPSYAQKEFSERFTKGYSYRKESWQEYCIKRGFEERRYRIMSKTKRN
ncbi:MAG: radical SAM protein [Firmicutes bacterium]|nr:radical SAM protein [Bacillota bacterium]